MWRPNSRNSKNIIFRKVTFDDTNRDECGHPAELHADTIKTVEIYPYSDVVKREAIGIMNQEAYTVITSGISPVSQDIFIIDGSIYKINSISRYEPLQLVISDSGEKEAVNGRF